MKKILLLLIIGTISATIANADGWNNMRKADSDTNKKKIIKETKFKNENRFKKTKASTKNTSIPKERKPQERKPLW
jgi:hypothetical protein